MTDETKPVAKKPKLQFNPSKMSHKQLSGELHRRSNRRPDAPYLMDQVWATALEIVFKNYRDGKLMFPGA